MKQTLKFAAVLSGLLGLLAACSPEVGSPEWCAQLKETPKGEWTTNQAADFAKHCLF